MSQRALEDLLAELSPQVLGALVRRHHDIERCEDALQEALMAAVAKWPIDGVPDNPAGWLVTVGHRRVVDSIRRDSAQRRRERRVLLDMPIHPASGAGFENDGVYELDPADDTLALMAMCAHRSLSTTSQMALTLRAVGGLTTAEIASAFLVPEATMTRRLTRAKATVSQRLAAGERFSDGERFGDGDGDRSASLAVIRRVLFLIFNEGYSATAGESLQRRELASEAIRLARLLLVLDPDDTESIGLLALMVLTDARHRARSAADGSLVTLAEQDRSLWDHDAIAEGATMVLGALECGRIGPYQLLAAIAAVHGEAATAAETDWPQILGLYRLLERVDPNPLHTLNRLVAQAEVEGPASALAELDGLAENEVLSRHHRMLVVRGDLLERLGDSREAAAAFADAARRSANVAEARHLYGRSRSCVDRENAEQRN